LMRAKSASVFRPPGCTKDWPRTVPSSVAVKIIVSARSFFMGCRWVIALGRVLESGGSDACFRRNSRRATEPKFPGDEMPGGFP